MRSKLSPVGEKLYEQLKTLWDHEDFILGVLSFADNDEDRQVVFDYIQDGEDVTTDSISLLALELHQNRYGEGIPVTLDQLEEAIIDCGNDVYFALDGLCCGIEPEVHNSVFAFKVWYGDQFQEYSDFELMVWDKFFGGKSIIELVDLILFDFR